MSTHIPYSAEHLDYAESEHEVRLMVNDPKALAWAWIWSYAKNLSRDEPEEEEDEYRYGSVTAEELIQTGMSNLKGGDRYGDYINKGSLLDGESTDPTFWDKLAILKGIDIPRDKRNNFFSCSC